MTNHCDILVPLNLENPSREALDFAATAGRLRTTLLYVVELNVCPIENRIYDDLCREYHQKLRDVAQQCLFAIDPRLCVRVGRADEEILKEAAESEAELIVLTPPRSRYRLPFRTTTVERVVRGAGCQTLVISDSSKAAVDFYRRTLAVSSLGKVSQACVGN